MSGPAAPIRIVVADDHPVVRDGLVAMLAHRSGASTSSARRRTAPRRSALVEETTPDVLLLDLEMPGLRRRRRARAVCARRASRHARDRLHRVRHRRADHRRGRGGSDGLSPQGRRRAPRSSRRSASYAAGGSLQLVAARVLEQSLARSQRCASAGGRSSLTPRELERARGFWRAARSNKQIAAALGVSERTVKFHVSALFAKLGATNRTEAVTRAIQSGLTTL